jgi:hypothetical protein
MGVLTRRELLTGWVPAAMRPTGHEWAKRVRQMCLDLRQAALSLVEWQRQTVGLFQHLPLEDLLATVSFDGLVRVLSLPKTRPGVIDLRLPGMEGLSDLQLRITVLALREGVAIPPHGHHNMASVHTVLKGEIHARHYERLSDEPGYLILRPSIDRRLGPGESTSVSDQRDNVHWLLARRGPAYLLDVLLPALDPSRPWGRDDVDLTNATLLPDGALRAPRAVTR